MLLMFLIFDIIIGLLSNKVNHSLGENNEPNRRRNASSQVQECG